MNATDLMDLPRAELRRLLQAGHAVSPDDLAGYEYRGVSLGLPAFVDKLAWKTFAKAFYRGAPGAPVRGWNLRLEQTGLQGPLTTLERRGQPWSFGHFAVRPASEGRGLTRTGVLLDYGRGGNHWWEGLGPVRDPVVSLRSGDATLLLGWTYLDLGPMHLGTPSYFTLERVRPLSFIAVPPRPTPALLPTVG